MKRIQQVLSFTVVFLVFAVICSVGSATVFLHDPSWETPGGYLQTPNGTSPAHSGGLTWEYTGFDPSAYDALYYVIGDYDYDPGPPEVWSFNAAGPAIGTAIKGMTRLAYNAGESDLSAGRVVWTATISIYDASTLTDKGYRARFTLQVYDALSQPTAVFDALTLEGMDARVGGTHQILGDFRARWLYELADLSSDNWQAAMPFFDALSTDSSDSLQTSVTRAFYYIGCFGDYNNDGDVDGTDLVAYHTSPTGIGLDDLAANFGGVNCP
jgi:hypothetical protein